MSEPGRVHRISDDEPENTGNSRKWLIGGAAAVVTAVVVGGVFVGLNGDGRDGQAGLQGEQRRIALSSVGYPLDASEENIGHSASEAQDALAGTLGAPVGAAEDKGIPERVLAAYRQAEAGAAAEFPNCHAQWWVLAGMGKVASDHAAGTTLDATGTTEAQIRGPRLDGRTLGTQLVLDTDKGELDGDAQYDRAMGPFQFLPGTWYLDARDGNEDGLANPDNIDDAALGASAVLCGGGADLTTPDGLARGLYRYTADPAVVSAILAWGNHYQSNVVPPKPTRTPAPLDTDHPPVPTAEAQPMDAEGAPLKQPTTPSSGETEVPPPAPGEAPPIVDPHTPPVPRPTDPGNDPTDGSRPPAPGVPPAPPNPAPPPPGQPPAPPRPPNTTPPHEDPPTRPDPPRRDPSTPPREDPPTRPDPPRRDPTTPPREDPTTPPRRDPTTPPRQDPTTPVNEEPTTPPQRDRRTPTPPREDPPATTRPAGDRTTDPGNTPSGEPDARDEPSSTGTASSVSSRSPSPTASETEHRPTRTSEATSPEETPETPTSTASESAVPRATETPPNSEQTPTST